MPIRSRAFGGRTRGLASLVLLVAATAACDDGDPAQPAATPDGAVDLGGTTDARAALPDAAPVPRDAAAPLPDAQRLGEVSLQIDPPQLTVTEGAEPAQLVVFVHGELQAPVELVFEGSQVEVEPTRATVEPDGPRAVTLSVRAPFDDDFDAEEGQVRVAGGDLSGVAEVQVRDVHRTFELVMDEEQVNFVRASRDKNRRMMVGTLIAGRPGPPAEINLRGKGSNLCRRRSFTVRFEDDVRIDDSPPLDHVLLLSMCMDSNYLKMRTSMEVIQALGLFPPWFTLVELFYGGQTWGVYLLVERPRKAIPRVFPENTTVIRRIWRDRQEIKRPREEDIEDPEAVLAPYLALANLRRDFDGAELLAELRRHMDYDRYMTWLAVNSVLTNGDYIDEAYFYDLRGPAGTNTPYFAVMGWDYDGIMWRCHTGRPIAAPLLYCAEGYLDAAVRDHEAVRDAYAEILRGVMDGPLTEENYGALLDRVAAEMAVYYRRPGVLEAMTREEEGPPVALPVAVEEMRQALAARRAELEMLLESP
jgi:hypothetical protein